MGNSSQFWTISCGSPNQTGPGRAGSSPVWHARFSGSHRLKTASLRPQDHANFDGAYLRDPDDTKIGLACHAPGP